jgi:hypothetical protein
MRLAAQTTVGCRCLQVRCAMRGLPRSVESCLHSVLCETRVGHGAVAEDGLMKAELPAAGHQLRQRQVRAAQLHLRCDVPSLPPFCSWRRRA